MAGPRPVYKYLPKRFADALIFQGKLRVGTLHGYRNIEQHKSGIGDITGGEKNQSLVVDGQVQWNKHNIPEFAGRFVKFDDTSTATFENIKFVQPLLSENLFVYCVSQCWDPALLTEFESDACVEIHDLPRFTRALSHVIRYRATYLAARACEYSGREHKYDENETEPALLKPESYASQREVRALWRPLRLPAMPFFAQCQRLRNTCRRIY